MSQHLTIAYITARKDSKVEWFLDSLENQLDSDILKLRVIIVDFFADSSDYFHCKRLHVLRTPPKPCVWQGPNRLTKENWFCAANSRNTSLCLAPEGYIAYVDDLSVLMPGWLTNVRQSMDWNGITLGAYRKVKNMVVKNGLVESFDKTWSGGRDSRWSFGSPNGSVPCNGDMLFGCSLVAPVEALLTVGGWPEMCNGLGFEDVIMGQVLENAGFQFRYNRNMLTFESEEHHGIEPSLRRDSFEKHPHDTTDKAHAVLNMAKGGMTSFGDNYYEGGIRKLRNEVLSGNPFPVTRIPEHCWHTKKHLSEL